MEPKSFDDINKYIDDIIAKNYFIDVSDIIKVLDKSDIGIKEKTEIIKRVDLYNKEVIRIYERENKILSKPIEDDENYADSNYSSLNEVSNTNTISPKTIKLPTIKNHIQQLLILTSEKEFENYLKKSIDKSNFEDTINLLIADILENIITIKKLINEDLLTSGSKCIFFNSELDKLGSILNVLYHLQHYTYVRSEDKHNKIVYLTTDAGNISISNDLKAIPIEFYDSIYNLLMSIQNGVFKEFKRIGTDSNNFKTNLLQVRENFTRVVFDKLSDDVYIILTVFIKKVRTSKDYLNNLRNVDTLLNSKLPYLYSQLKNNKEEFLKSNDLVTEALFRKLLTKNKGEDIRGKINGKH